ncbi:hypothetical protein GCM10009554_10300 [Kribbella koreensis]|uniref:PH (Pleckstrin Homology) domain-containing protein n=1 Tax=Kribbella koreensis TaxID=57909 RepID=A0ABP3ZXK1_9ACTN
MSGVETLSVPVRRVRRVFYLTGTALFGGLVGYLVAAGSNDDYVRLGFHIGVAGLAVYAFEAVRLYYGILTGRSKLTIGPRGITLGDRRIDWADIQDITLRPTSPVLGYLAFGPPSVRIQGRKASQRIDVTRDHVKDLEGFAAWLESVRQR